MDKVCTVKKEYILDGLCCSNCAAKIEREVGELDGVSSASIDLISKTLTMEIEKPHEMDNLVTKTHSIVKSHEPDIVIREKTVDHSENKEPLLTSKQKANGIIVGIGALLFIAAMLFKLNTWLEFSLFIISYLLIGGEILLKAAKNIVKGQVFDENFLMSVATIGAFAVGQYPEGVAVMLFYQIGEFFQKLAVSRSRRSISALMDIRPDYANLKTGDTIRKVSPEEVEIGDLIVVKSGEKIPLDGKVVAGKALMDTSALTGESLPRDVEINSEVLAGSINRDGMLTIEVTKEFGESTLSKILNLVQNSSKKKAPTENFITKFARYYTPCVVFGALALAFLPPLFVSDIAFSECIHRALVFLVVSCPCALVISVPLSYFGGIGGASRSGILIKGSNYLDTLDQVDTVVFDKTGTLTKGVFKVTKISAADGFTEERILSLAAHAESFSNHPISVSIQQAYDKPLNVQSVTEQEELPGRGIRARVDGFQIYAGNSRLMEEQGIIYSKVEDIGTVVYLAVDGVFAGHLVISDEIKPDSAQSIRNLKTMGIRKTVMLTGDNKMAADKIAKEIGLDGVYSELLPDQKVEQLERLGKERTGKGKTAFIGDGINDAPVLARADVGIAMGGIGSDAAIEAADVVLMTDEPSKIVSAIQTAKKTKRIVWQNILFALSVKAVILVLGAFGIATMWEAVFGDVGVTCIAVLNSMRALRIKK